MDKVYLINEQNNYLFSLVLFILYGLSNIYILEEVDLFLCYNLIQHAFQSLLWILENKMPVRLRFPHYPL